MRATRFAHKVTTWRLPARGGVAALADMDGGGGALGHAGPSRSDSGRTGGASGFPGPGYKRVRLRRKTPVHEVFRDSLGDQSRPRVWKRLRLGVSLVTEDDDAGGRQLHDHLYSGVHGFFIGG